ncbi:MAG: DUF6785 family protein [Armatimonadota bacterium]
MNQSIPDASAPRWTRVAGVGIPLLVANAGWIAHSEMRNRVTEITITPLFIGVLFLHFVLALANLGLERWAPALALRASERIAIFAGLSVATAIAGIGNLGFLLPAMVSPWWFGSAENWSGFLQELPSSLGPRDPESLRAFHLGHRSLLEPGLVLRWIPSLAMQGGLFLSLATCTLGVAALLRRRWSEQEHLLFPSIALPLELARPGIPILRSGVFWLGFALPCILHSLNSVNSLAPTVPGWPINSFRQGLEGVARPWTGLGSVPIMIHPCGVGTGFLVQTDILFSLLFFWVAKKALNLWGTTMGWRDDGPEEYGDGKEQFPFTGWQAWGAWIAIGFGVVVGMARGIAKATAGERLAGWVACAGFASACGFAWAAGAPWWLPPAFLGTMLLLLFAVARVQAETPVMSMMLAWVFPQAIWTGVFGTVAFSRIDFAHMAGLGWMNLDYRAALLPQQMAGMVAGRRCGVRPRSMTWMLLAAAVIGFLAAVAWDLDLYHRFGAATAHVNPYRIAAGKGPYRQLAAWLSTTTPPNPKALAGMGTGGAMVVALGWMRGRWVGFPLAPAGYALTTSFAHEHYWMDMAIALACKASILRFSGMKGYRAALPFFHGLILGDFVTAALWTLVAAWLGVPVFRTFPN